MIGGTKTIITYEADGNKFTAELPDEQSIQDIGLAFHGLLVLGGWHPKTIDEIMVSRETMVNESPLPEL
jgi:hypothetical protein